MNWVEKFIEDKIEEKPENYQQLIKEFENWHITLSEEQPELGEKYFLSPFMFDHNIHSKLVSRIKTVTLKYKDFSFSYPLIVYIDPFFIKSIGAHIWDEMRKYDSLRGHNILYFLDDKKIIIYGYSCRENLYSVNYDNPRAANKWFCQFPFGQSLRFYLVYRTVEEEDFNILEKVANRGYANIFDDLYYKTRQDFLVVDEKFRMYLENRDIIEPTYFFSEFSPSFSVNLEEYFTKEELLSILSIIKKYEKFPEKLIDKTVSIANYKKNIYQKYSPYIGGFEEELLKDYNSLEELLYFDFCCKNAICFDKRFFGAAYSSLMESFFQANISRFFFWYCLDRYLKNIEV